MYRKFLCTVLSDDTAFRRFFAFLWAIIIGPVLIGMVFLTPPIQVPDEEHHFLRAVQIGEGGFIGEHVSPWTTGGFLPRDSMQFAHSFDDIFFHSDRKITVARVLDAQSKHWDTPRVAADFPNTVIYAPFFYLPQALGIDAGRVLHHSVLVSFYMGRLASAVMCVVLGALALAITQRGRVIMALVLSLPMTLALDASCSQDGLFIASCALGVALLTRMRDGAMSHGLADKRWYWVVLAVVLACLLASKPPYILITLLPLLYAPKLYRMKAAGVAVCAVFVMLLWVMFGMHPVDITAAANGPVSEHRQAQHLLHHPWFVAGLMVHTVSAFGASLYGQYIGVLGWLDAPVPQWFYRFMRWGILLGVCSAVVQARFTGSLWAWGQRLGTLAVGLGTICGVSLALYLIWTPVGETLITGLQGRYYLGLSFLFVLAFPESARTSGARLWRMGDVVLVALIPLCASVAAYETLVLRYW